MYPLLFDVKILVEFILPSSSYQHHVLQLHLWYEPLLKSNLLAH